MPSLTSAAHLSFREAADETTQSTATSWKLGHPFRCPWVVGEATSVFLTSIGKNPVISGDTKNSEEEEEMKGDIHFLLLLVGRKGREGEHCCCWGQNLSPFLLCSNELPPHSYPIVRGIGRMVGISVPET